MTIEKTNEESTIITSSSVSILPAAVDACSPSQFGISMITEVTAVRTSIAAISLGRGRPRTGGILFREPEGTAAGARGSRHDRRQPLQLAVRGGDHRPRPALPAPELVDPPGQREAGLPVRVRFEAQPALQAIGKLGDGVRVDRKAEQ